jgi:hypothetical protein
MFVGPLLLTSVKKQQKINELVTRTCQENISTAAAPLLMLYM